MRIDLIMRRRGPLTGVYKLPKSDAMYYSNSAVVTSLGNICMLNLRGHLTIAIQAILTLYTCLAIG